MAQVKIAKVINKLAKNGTTKLCSIKTIGKDGTEFWIGGFGNSTTESWREGQTIELEVYQEEYNGKMGWKFKTPVERNVFDELDKMIDILKSLQSFVAKLTPEKAKQATPNPKTSPVQDLPPNTTPEMSVKDIEKVFGQDPDENVPDFLK